MELRCQECGAVLGDDVKFGSCECSECGADAHDDVMKRTRARKRFELVVAMMCRPVGQWVNDNHTAFTYPMPDEAETEADSILNELYGPVKGEGDG